MTAGRDWTKEEIRKEVDELSAVTVPVNISFKAKQKILDLAQVERLLRASRKIAIANCECRTKVHGCDAPVDVCLFLGEAAEDQVKKGLGRRVSLKEALAALKRSNEAGLVHLALTDRGEKGPNYICSCCSCCCSALIGLQKYGFHDSLVSSDMIAAQDSSLCNDCGICVDRCHFRARRLVDDRLIFEKERCFGCGVCLISCPTDAIYLEKRRAN